MSKADKDTAIKNKNAAAIRQFRSHQLSMLEITRANVKKVRGNAILAHASTMKERNELLAKFAESLDENVKHVRHQHELVRDTLRSAAIKRDVHVRVNRSLESLEELVRVMRESSDSEQRLMEAIEDPVVSSSLTDRARRTSASALLQSIQKQLSQEYEFINMAAHELRTPIMPILANAEILQGKLPERSKELEAISRNGQRLQQLAENILAASRIDSKTFTLNKESFDINLMIQQLILDKERFLSDKNIRVVFIPQTEELFVLADEIKISQVVSNLVDNAIKFASQTITVTTESDEKKVTVTVRDDGPGISDEVLPIMFSKFVSKSVRGTGLGLYIAKNVIDAHGGTIEGKNSDSERRGAVFVFTLPL